MRDSERNDLQRAGRRETYRKYRAANAERIRFNKRLQMRRWRAANTEKARRIERESYYRNKEARLERRKKQYYSNRPKSILIAIGCCPAPQSLIDAYANGCSYCGEKNKPLQLDHIKPKSRGGSSEADNLQWLCKPCNYGKQDMLEEDYFAHVKKVFLLRFGP